MVAILYGDTGDHQNQVLVTINVFHNFSTSFCILSSDRLSQLATLVDSMQEPVRAQVLLFTAMGV